MLVSVVEMDRRCRVLDTVRQIRTIQPADHDMVRAFLRESGNLYPQIEQWCNRKALPGLRSGQRVGFLAETEKGVDGLIIVKRGTRSKICSLRVKDSARNKGWGKELVRQALTTLAAEGSRSAYVTVSEALDDIHRQFFERLGFVLCGRLKSKYVSGIDELVYSWPAAEMAAFIAQEAPLANDAHWDRPPQTKQLPNLLMSLRPPFSRLVLEGRKTVEFRRRFSRKHIGALVLFYTSSPTSSFQFTARISDVKYNTLEDLWSAFHATAGIDRDTFDTYFQGKDAGYALQLEQIAPLPRPVNLSTALAACPYLNPPQSFRAIQPDPSFVTLWNDAILMPGGEVDHERRNTVS